MKRDKNSRKSLRLSNSKKRKKRRNKKRLRDLD
jgi:hypothetical protein